jgi:hypothetical protein
MASTGKPKTTRAKLQREATLRERRLEKAVRKQVRKQAALDPDQPDELEGAFDLEAPEGVADISASLSESGTSL